jgi:hypothetical protein
MEDRYISKRLSGVGDVSYHAAKEAAGVAAGFGIAGYTGTFFESRYKPNVDAFSSTSDKLTALAVNNVPKIALWLGMKMKGPDTVRDSSDMLWVDARKGVIGNVGLDIGLRLMNHLAPPDMNFGKKVLGQKDAQRLIQENTALRENYNKALAKLSEVTGMQIQAPRAGTRAATPVPPAGGELQTPRQKKYAFMPGPAARQKKYAFMPGDIDEKSVAAAHGML